MEPPAPLFIPRGNMENTKTIEQRVSDAILDKTLATIEVNGVELPIAPPSPAVLIEIAGLASTLPHFQADSENVLLDVLQNAHHARTYARIIATAIIGVRPRAEVFPRRLDRWRQRLFPWRRRVGRKSVPDASTAIDRLAEDILYGVRLKTQNQLIRQILIDQDVADFFGLTISLSEPMKKITAPTREMGS